MTIDEAIKIVAEILADEDSRWEQDGSDALQLLIEAGEREVSIRLRYPLPNNPLLPSETKE